VLYNLWFFPSFSSSGRFTEKFCKYNEIKVKKVAFWFLSLEYVVPASSFPEVLNRMLKKEALHFFLLAYYHIFDCGF